MKVRIVATAEFKWFWLLQDVRYGDGVHKPDQFGPFDTEEEARAWEAKFCVEPYEEVYVGRSFTKSYAKDCGLEWYRAPTGHEEQAYGLVRNLVGLEDVVEAESV
jgi:hypothetical protein